jgi:hypothetical protein
MPLRCIFFSLYSLDICVWTSVSHLLKLPASRLPIHALPSPPPHISSSLPQKLLLSLLPSSRADCFYCCWWSVPSLLSSSSALPFTILLPNLFSFSLASSVPCHCGLSTFCKGPCVYRAWIVGWIKVPVSVLEKSNRSGTPKLDQALVPS